MPRRLQLESPVGREPRLDAIDRARELRAGLAHVDFCGGLDRPLKVAGAFHSPLMQAAAERMRAELDKVAFAAPKFTVYANVTAAPHGEAESIKRLLVEQIVRPVKWEQTMQTLIPTPEMRFVELAPQRTLAGLAKKINRRLPIESLAEWK